MTMNPLNTLLNLMIANRRLAAGVALFIWAWGIVYLFTGYHSNFTSQSMVIIKDSAFTNRYVVSDQNYALSTTSSNSANPVLNTMGLLKSESISEDLWRFFKTKHPEELKKRRIKTRSDWEAFFGQGKGFVKAKNEPGTDLIAIQFTWDDPKIAQEALGVTLAAFREASLKVNQAEQRNRFKFLSDKVAQIETQLQQIRTTKSDYKAQNGTVDVGQESGALAASGIDLATQLNRLEADARGKETEYRRYQKVLNMNTETALQASALGMNSTLAGLQDNYYKLSQNYALLKSTLTDKNPKVIEAKNQMTAVQTAIKQEMRRTLGKNAGNASHIAIADSSRGRVIDQMVAAQSDALRLRSEAQVLRGRLSQVDQKLASMPHLEKALSDIEDQEKSLSNALYVLRQKQLEAQMKEAETFSNVFVVDPPVLPMRPGFPTHTHVLFLTFMMGLGGAVVAVGAKELIRDSSKATKLIKTIGELTEVDLFAEGSLRNRPQSGPRDARETMEKILSEMNMDDEDTLDFLFNRMDKKREAKMSKKDMARMKELRERLYEALQEEKRQQTTTGKEVAGKR